MTLRAFAAAIGESPRHTLALAVWHACRTVDPDAAWRLISAWPRVDGYRQARARVSDARRVDARRATLYGLSIFASHMDNEPAARAFARAARKGNRT
jgi:hypothetical protein